MVVQLGGPGDLVDVPSRHLQTAPVTIPIDPLESGHVNAVDVRAVGIAIVNLGGGRAREDDRVDHSVGLTEVAALGERVDPGGRPLALVHARDDESARRAADEVRAAYFVGDPPGEVPPPVIEIQRAV
jgi:thymidine phosphorylase